MARIDPLPRDEWPAEMLEILAAMPRVKRDRKAAAEQPQGGEVFGIFAYHPDLARVSLALSGHLLSGTTLTDRQREILVLRVAAVRKSRYHWVQHLFVGRDIGMTDEEMARIAFGPDAPFLEPLEAALLRAVDELIGDGVISDETWRVLADDLDTKQLMDVIFTVGAYETLAYLFRSFGLEPDDDDPEPLGPMSAWWT